MDGGCGPRRLERVRIAAVVEPRDVRPCRPLCARSTLLAAAVTFASSALFLGLQGFYAERLAWNLASPMLVVAAAIAARIERDASPAWRIATTAARVGAALFGLVHEMLKPGPWV